MPDRREEPAAAIKHDETTARSRYLGHDYRRVITIRKSTPEERAAKSPPIAAGGSRCPIPKWVVVYEEPTPGMLPFFCVFGMPMGGKTRAEAVFWAERGASKNDLNFVRPGGWENVEGMLPDGD